MEQYNIEDESGDKKYFTIIPNYILNHSTLYDREVYIQMKRIAGERGTCWKSQENLAKQCGISINRLKKSLKYLIEHKWIKFNGKRIINTKGGPQELNEYSVIDLWSMNSNFYEDKGVSRNDIPTSKGCHESAKGVSPGDDKEEPVKEEPIISEQGSLGKKTTYNILGTEVIKLFEKVDPKNKAYYGNTTQRKACDFLLEEYGFEQVSKIINILPKSNKIPYMPIITTPVQLRDKWAQLDAGINKKKIELTTNKGRGFQE